MDKTDISLDWKQNVVEELTLPSGRRIKFMIPSLMSLMANEDIPNPLIAMAEKQADGNMAAHLAAHPEDLSKGIKVMQVLICAGIVEPNIVMKRISECSEGEISIELMTDKDLVFLYGKIEGVVAKLEPFRGKQPPLGKTTKTVKRISSKAKRNSKNKK